MKCGLSCKTQPSAANTQRSNDQALYFTFALKIRRRAPMECTERCAGQCFRHNHFRFSHNPHTMIRRHQAVSILQASQDSPTFARLTELTRDSVARLRAVEFLIPAPLRASVTAGPIDGPVWCLILNNNAAAAKIRQLVPSFQSHLRVKGWDVDSIRLKVQINKPN